MRPLSPCSVWLPIVVLVASLASTPFGSMEQGRIESGWGEVQSGHTPAPRVANEPQPAAAATGAAPLDGWYHHMGHGTLQPVLRSPRQLAGLAVDNRGGAPDGAPYGRGVHSRRAAVVRLLRRGEVTLTGTEALRRMKSVADLGAEKGEKPLPENVSVDPAHVIGLGRDRRPGKVREGTF